VSAAAAWIGLCGALGGVLVGGLISFMTTTLTERARWRRDSAVRWEGRLVEALAEYAAALKMQSRMCLRISGGYWPDMTTNPIDRTEGAQLIARFEDERSVHFERLLLLADAEVIKSARAWQEAVWALHVIQNGPAAIDQTRFKGALQRAADLRNEYYATARGTLGVSGSLDPAPVRTYT
jgi:hypothetical protein